MSSQKAAWKKHKRKCKPESGRVLAAVKQDGLALRSASKELRGDRELVRAAVKESGRELSPETEEMKSEMGVGAGSFVLLKRKFNGIWAVSGEKCQSLSCSSLLDFRR